MRSLRVTLHLPLAIVHLLLQGLQVGQEGLVELRQLGVLFRARSRAYRQQHINTQVRNVRLDSVCNLPA